MSLPKAEEKRGAPRTRSNVWRRSRSDKAIRRATASLPMFPTAACGSIPLDSTYPTNSCWCCPAMGPPEMARIG